MAPNKFSRQILNCKEKERNKNSLQEWNSYLKKLYESLEIRDKITIKLKPSLLGRKFSF